MQARSCLLYGIGARLDDKPELLFSLRRVDAKDLIAQAGAGVPLAKSEPATAKILGNAGLSELFGIEMAGADKAGNGEKSKGDRTDRQRPRRGRRKAAQAARDFR